MVPIVARKTGVRRFVAQRLEAGAVPTHPLVRVRRPLREGLAEVRELADAGERPLAAGDVGVAARDDLLDPGRAASRPSSAASTPPASSIRPSSSHPAAARSSVSFSTAYAPPAGSATRARCDSEISSDGGVAGDPAAEGVRYAERGVERQHGDRVRSPDAGREGRDGGAQHVHPRVVLAHHRPAGDGVLPLLAGLGLAQLEHARPEPACGAELGDGRELLVGGGVPELDQRRPRRRAGCRRR